MGCVTDPTNEQSLVFSDLNFFISCSGIFEQTKGIGIPPALPPALKQRVSGGKSYRAMSFGMKKMVDQKLENKARQSAIKRFTKRKVKDKRKLDIARRK